MLIRHAPHRVVRLHSAPASQLESAGFCKLLPRPHACAHDEQLDVQDLLLASHLDLHPLQATVARQHLEDLHACVNFDAQRLDLALEHGAGLSIQLHRHQPRRHFQHVRLQFQVVGCLGSFQTQKASPNHCSSLRILGPLRDLEEVIDRPVNMHTGHIERQAWYRRQPRFTPCCQHQLVVGSALHLTFRCGVLYAFRSTIDLRRLSKEQLHAIGLTPLHTTEGQLIGIPMLKEGSQLHPVIGGVILLADDHNLKGSAFGQELRHNGVAHRAPPYDNHTLPASHGRLQLLQVCRIQL
mmetsp:Transcript_67788/g.161784  ORF Transcript_67788/g.161784 Transcript_67788/m.161784 type:complete len:296 (-) Transcript_67788:111-998(-)